MKIVAVNGSPKGRTSNTNVMVNAFLAGARQAGAETDSILLADKEIKYCRGCYSCWTKTPDKCVIQDEMSDVLSCISAATVILLATPLYFNNVSGTMKVFIDRLTVTGNPYSQRIAKEKQIASGLAQAAPKLMIMSNCGFPVKAQFDVISLWMKRLALMMQTELIGEIYVTEGKHLSALSSEMRPSAFAYLKLLERAGKDIAGNLQLSETIKDQLNQAVL